MFSLSLRTFVTPCIGHEKVLTDSKTTVAITILHSFFENNPYMQSSKIIVEGFCMDGNVEIYVHLLDLTRDSCEKCNYIGRTDL